MTRRALFGLLLAPFAGDRSKELDAIFNRTPKVVLANRVPDPIVLTFRDGFVIHLKEGLRPVLTTNGIKLVHGQFDATL